jgi:hypothetical protein
MTSELQGWWASTILADLFTPLLFADLFSAMRPSLRRRSSDEFDDGVAHESRLQFRSLNHVHNGAIKPQQPLAVPLML